MCLFGCPQVEIGVLVCVWGLREKLQGVDTHIYARTSPILIPRQNGHLVVCLCRATAANTRKKRSSQQTIKPKSSRWACDMLTDTHSHPNMCITYEYPQRAKQTESLTNFPSFFGVHMHARLWPDSVRRLFM